MEHSGRLNQGLGGPTPQFQAPAGTQTPPGTDPSGGGSAPQSLAKRRKRVLKSNRHRVYTHGLPVELVVRTRKLMRESNPGVTHEELDRLIEDIAKRCPELIQK